MTLPTRPRELPLTIIVLMLTLLFVIVRPMMSLPVPGNKDQPNFDSLRWFLFGLPLMFVVWLPYVAYRGLGFIAIGGMMLGLSVAYAEAMNEWNCHWLSLVQGIACGFLIGASLRYLYGISRAIGRLSPERQAFIYSRNKTVFIAGTLLMMVSAASIVIQVGSREQYRQIAEWKLLIVAGSLAIIGIAFFYRSLFELMLEPPFSFMYKVKGSGPGIRNMPAMGPCILIANHAAWLDPLFLGKVIPRPVTAMMTSRFFQMRLLRPILRYIFRVIVVAESGMRREAPEIQLAIAALDRGDCVMLFPEGFLRRKEEVPLRRFGQGIWQLLQARPDTPVIACWIENTWGSLCSFGNGAPPLKNKKLDVRRPVGVAVSSPQTVPKELLTDHMKTRIYLMNCVSTARQHIGLAPLPVFEIPPKSESNDDNAQSE